MALSKEMSVFLIHLGLTLSKDGSSSLLEQMASNMVAVETATFVKHLAMAGKTSDQPIQVALSPDGKLAAYLVLTDQPLGWVYDLALGALYSEIQFTNSNISWM